MHYHRLLDYELTASKELLATENKEDFQKLMNAFEERFHTDVSHSKIASENRKKLAKNICKYFAYQHVWRKQIKSNRGELG